MKQGSNSHNVHGWIVLDKPLGMTSARAVGRVKRLFGVKKAGHAGTLDPLATGLLAIALGEATKTVSFAMDGRKTYQFTIVWGRQTETDDGEGATIDTSEVRPESPEIEAVIPEFTGLIMQRPPIYSALKVKGRRAYKLARSGVEVTLESRPVEIDTLSYLGSPDRESARFEAKCAKGTYIRALGRDIAERLGTKGHIGALRRTASGYFNQKHMILLDKLEQFSHIGARQETLLQTLLPVETVLDDIPVLAISGEEAALIRNGQAILLSDRNVVSESGRIALASNGSLVALAEIKDGALHPKRVFNLPANS